MFSLFSGTLNWESIGSLAFKEAIIEFVKYLNVFKIVAGSTIMAALLQCSADSY